VKVPGILNRVRAHARHPTAQACPDANRDPPSLSVSYPHPERGSSKIGHPCLVYCLLTLDYWLLFVSCTLLFVTFIIVGWVQHSETHRILHPLSSPPSSLLCHSRLRSGIHKNFVKHPDAGSIKKELLTLLKACPVLVTGEKTRGIMSSPPVIPALL
jgi:hypothetical protein